MTTWVGRGLRTEDKAFKPYDMTPFIYFYWRTFHTLIAPLVEVYGSLGIGE
jgi:hypothetical protein